MSELEFNSTDNRETNSQQVHPHMAVALLSRWTPPCPNDKPDLPEVAESAAVGREGEKDLLLLLKSITQHPPTGKAFIGAPDCCKTAFQNKRL